MYKYANWSKVIGISRGCTLSEAFEIASKDPKITFFFYVKGFGVRLETEDGNYRDFRQNDAVFFAGEPWWGSASSISDGYVKLKVTKAKVKSKTRAKFKARLKARFKTKAKAKLIKAR